MDTKLFIKDGSIKQADRPIAPEEFFAIEVETLKVITFRDGMFYRYDDHGDLVEMEQE